VCLICFHICSRMLNRTRRWQRQKKNTADLSTNTSGTSPTEEHTSVSIESHRGHVLDDGTAYFPMMSEREVASISVSARAQPDRVRSTLAEHGVCLVIDVLNEQECSHFENLWNADLLNVLGAAKVDANKAAMQRFREEGMKAWPQSWSRAIGKKGVASQRGLPHGAFAWNCRMHSEVRKTFANIFETSVDDLAVGLDCIFWSSADTPPSESNTEWLHCDQNHRTGLTWPCVQGVLYVWPSETENSSTTVVWPGSHHEVYDRIMRDRTAIKRGRSIDGQSVKLSHLSDCILREELTNEAMVACRRVPCPSGSLLLWDSRTIHQGWAGGPRLAQPVCWEPRQRREDDHAALGRKIFMCTAGLPSSHSSAEARVHGMAPRSRPWQTLEIDDSPAFRAQIRPFCIAEERKREWEQAQHSLWSRGAIEEIDPRPFAKLLKPEILAVL